MKLKRIFYTASFILMIMLTLTSCMKTNKKTDEEHSSNQEAAKEIKITTFQEIKDRQVIGWINHEEVIVLKENRIMSDSNNVSKFFTAGVYNLKTKEEKIFQGVKIQDNYRLSPDNTKLLYEEAIIDKDTKPSLKILNITDGTISSFLNFIYPIFHEIVDFRWIDDHRIMTIELKRDWTIYDLKENSSTRGNFGENSFGTWVGAKGDIVYFTGEEYFAGGRQPKQSLRSFDINTNKVNTIFAKDENFNCLYYNNTFIITMSVEGRNNKLLVLDEKGFLIKDLNVQPMWNYYFSVIPLNINSKAIYIEHNSEYSSLYELDLTTGNSKALLRSQLLSDVSINSKGDTLSIVGRNQCDPGKSSYIIQPENLASVPIIIEENDEAVRKKDEALKELKESLKENYPEESFDYSFIKATYINEQIYYWFRVGKKMSDYPTNFYINLDKKEIYEEVLDTKLKLYKKY